MKRIDETIAGRTISVWAIFDPTTGALAGKILAHEARAGFCRVEVFDFTDSSAEVQFSQSSGYGQNNFVKACDGLTIAGVAMHDESKNVDGWAHGQPVPVGAKLANAGKVCHWVAGPKIYEAYGFCVERLL